MQPRVFQTAGPVVCNSGIARANASCGVFAPAVDGVGNFSAAPLAPASRNIFAIDVSPNRSAKVKAEFPSSSTTSILAPAFKSSAVAAPSRSNEIAVRINAV